MAGKSPPKSQAQASSGGSGDQSGSTDSGWSWASFGMDAVRGFMGTGASPGLLGGLLGNSTAPPDPKEQLKTLRALPESGQLDELKKLLNTGWFDSVSKDELWMATELLSGMSEAGKRQFIEMENGELYETFVDAGLSPAVVAPEKPEEEKGWWETIVDGASDLVDWGADLVETGADYANLGWDSVKHWFSEGDATVDLDILQDALGGSFGGLELAETGNDEVNRLEVKTDTELGRVEVLIPKLQVAGASFSAEGAQIDAGAGEIQDVKLVADIEESIGADAGIQADIGRIAWGDICVASDAMQVVVPRLVAMALHAESMKSEGPSTPTNRETVEDDLVDHASQKLEDIARALLEVTSGFAGYVPSEDGDRPEPMLASLADDFAGRQDFAFSFASLCVEGAEVTEPDGTKHRADEVSIDGFAATIEKRDTIVQYEEERQTLASLRSPGVEEKARLKFLESELPRLRTCAEERLTLETKFRSGVALQPAERDRYIELDRELTIGVADVKVGRIAASNVDAAGTHVDSASLSDLSATVVATDLDRVGIPGVHDGGPTGDEKLDALNARLSTYAEQKGPAPAKTKPSATPKPTSSLPRLNGMSVDARLGHADVQGLKTKDASVGSASLDGASLSASEDAMRGSVGTAEVSNVVSPKARVDQGSVRGLGVSGQGSKLHADVGAVKAQGVGIRDNGTSVGIGAASAQGGRIDADLASGEVTGVSVNQAGASKLAIDSRKGEHIEVDSAEVVGATGAGINAKGAKSLNAQRVGVDGFSLQKDDARVEIASADVANASLRDVRPTGVGHVGAGSVTASQLAVDTPNASAHADQVSVQGASVDGIRPSGDVASVNAEGITADAVVYRDAGRMAAADDVSVSKLSAQGVSPQGAAAVAVGGVSAGEVIYEDPTQKVAAKDLRVEGIGATNVGTGGVEAASVDGLSTGNVVYKGDDRSASLGSTNVEGLTVRGAGPDGVAAAGVGSVAVSDLQYSDAERKVSAEQAGINGVSATGVGPTGVETVNVAGAGMTGVHYEDTERSVAVGSANVEGIAVRGAGPEGVDVANVDAVRVADAKYRDEDVSANVRSANVQGLSASNGPDGSVVSVQGAQANGVGVADTASGAKGSVDQLSVGRSGVVLDGENNVVGAEVNDAAIRGVRFAMQMAGGEQATTPATGGKGAGPATPSAPFAADALAGASGLVKAQIPLKEKGLIRGVNVEIPVQNGLVHLDAVKVVVTGKSERETWLGKLLGDAATGMVQVQPGRGLVIGLGGLSLTTLLDSRAYDGLLTKKKAGGRGAIALEPLVEGLQNGVTRAEITDEGLAKLDAEDRKALRRERRRDRRDERRAERAERSAGGDAADDADATDNSLAGLGISVGKAKVDVQASLGDGRIGTDAAHATLAGQTDGANAFTVRGTLDHLEAGSHLLRASELVFSPVTATEVGVEGVRVVVDQPLSSRVSFTLDVAGGQVKRVRYGDVSKLDSAPGEVGRT